MAEEAWVKITDEGCQVERAEDIYDKVRAEHGSPFNIQKGTAAWSALNDLQEAEFEFFFAGTDTALGCDIKDLVGVLVSQLNKSDYCDGWYRAALQLRGWSDEKVTHIMQDIASGHLDPAGRAVLALADKIERRPQAIDPADISAARAAGLTDRCIMEVAALTGYLDSMTRLANVLGVMNGESADAA